MDRIALEDCHLQLLVDPRELGSSWQARLDAALDGGVDLVQLRMKVASCDERVQWGRRVAERLGPRRIALLVNDDVEAAIELAGVAAGVHLGQGDVLVEAARARLGPAAAIGLSTHSCAEVVAGNRTSATHFGLGACWPTATKPDHRVLSRDELARAVAAANRPLFAIGGITAARAPELAALGVRRVAVASALLAAPDPAEEAAALLRALHPRA